MPYAEVSVNSPASLLPTFSYHVPEGLQVEPGQAVWVPFGKRTVQGIVICVSPEPGYTETRDITGLISYLPKLSGLSLELAEWLSQYYRCPLYQALSLFMPAGFQRRSIAVIRPGQQASTFEPGEDEDRNWVMQELSTGSVLKLSEIERKLSKPRARKTVSALEDGGFVSREFEIAPRKVKPKLEIFIAPTQERSELDRVLGKLRTTAGKQAALLSLVADRGEMRWLEASAATGAGISVARALEQKGLVSLAEQEKSRKPIAWTDKEPEKPLAPSRSQSEALKDISASIGQSEGKAFLLHGITGSGKTEVYLQALARTIEAGKKAIVLVPEISLTPQTIERFTARFPNQVAILHSRLSPGERYDQWREIYRGDYNVVIGARSAVFAPQPDLGLVVIDEEHDWSYKQDVSPRYHARKVALKLGRLCRATVILGSATPDVESYYNALRGNYVLLHLPDRPVLAKPSQKPEIILVDLRQELKSGNRSIFSRALQEAIRRNLAQKCQVILFLNRRGGATFVQCRDCGFVIGCRRCMSPMTYHPDSEQMVCHHCNWRTGVPVRCPDCSSRRIKYLGLGTQSLEKEVLEFYPGARVIRWDSDVVKSGGAGTIDEFRSGKYDVLIGTQMITKGLDMPRVGLVGVVNADTGLNLPDFRSGEHTFDQLSQVAGRTGRRDLPGQVIIQSYRPDNYAIQAASKNDYRAFYDTEIGYRRKLGQPPFSKLIRLTFSHHNDSFSYREALRLKSELSEKRNSRGLTSNQVLGPAPSFIYRLRGMYRWCLVLKGNDPASLLDGDPLPRRWEVDVDPYGP